MEKTQTQPNCLGKKNGRKIGTKGITGIHSSQWMPDSHPGTTEIPYILYPRSITIRENISIRKIWASSGYSGKEFAPFEVNEVPGKYKLGQVIACGIKAACATYSQHWQGMYFDWTFNDQCKKALEKFTVMMGNECFVKNAFATVILINTGYGGDFMDMLRLRRRTIPPSMPSLEQIDMGTFEHNLKCAIGAILGGHIGVNIIRQSMSRELVKTKNKEGYEALKKLVMIPGMDFKGNIVTIMQLGFKQPQDRATFDSELMKLAGAKLVERKSERRNADFSQKVQPHVLSRFLICVNNNLRRYNVKGAEKIVVVEGDAPSGHQALATMRERISLGLDMTREQVISAYDQNMEDNLFQCKDRFPDFNSYEKTADLIAELGKKVLKPREDGHKMVFIAIDMNKLEERKIPIDIAEQAVGEAIQAGLNSIHLDGTTDIPENDDLRYGAFCLTGPIHSIELTDSDEQLLKGWGTGFCNIIPEITPTHKMLAIVAICAKHEQDAFIAEKQAMEQRKSVNDIFWYRTWNHPEGKKLDLPHWISFADVLHVLPIPDNNAMLNEEPLPAYLPEGHPITTKLLGKKDKFTKATRRG